MTAYTKYQCFPQEVCVCVGVGGEGINLMGKNIDRCINKKPNLRVLHLRCLMSKPTAWATEDSDQPVHPPSLIRVFAVRMKKAWVLSYPLSAQGRLWSDWVDAQADLSLRWAHSHFVGFVTRRLIYFSRKQTVFFFLLLQQCLTGDSNNEDF